MVQLRLSMRKLEEILRLKYKVGLIHRATSKSCAVSTSTVSEYVPHVETAGISWPLPEGINDEELERLLFSTKDFPRGPLISQLDWKTIRKELKRKSVTP